MLLTMSRAPLALGLLSLIWAAAPNPAAACACCDGASEVEPVGWSDDGRTVLLRREELGCADTLTFDVLRLGDRHVSECYDAYADDPGVATDCQFEHLTTGYDRFGLDAARPSGTTPVAANYPLAPRAVAAERLRATLEHALPREEFEFDVPAELHVQFWDGRRWHTLARKRVSLGGPELHELPTHLSADEQAVVAQAQPVEVTIWPAQSNGEAPRSAILEIQGHNMEPGMGYFGDEMIWIEVPTGLRMPTVPARRARPVIAAPTPSMSPVQPTLYPLRPDLYERDTPPTEEERRDASTDAVQRMLRAGLARHRRGAFIESARAFATILALAPNSDAARYDLACAYARLGQDEAALAELGVLAAQSDCESCQRRLRRARRDEDLRHLRARLPQTVSHR